MREKIDWSTLIEANPRRGKSFARSIENDTPIQLPTS